MQDLLDKAREGDISARNELLQHVAERLRHLVRKMFGGYPKLRRWLEEDDVMQNALLRLNKAFDDVAIEDLRHFYNLAIVQVRRELIDLSRHFYGPHGIGANHQTGNGPPDEPGGLIHDVVARKGGGNRWLQFHEAVETLSPEDQEIVNLVFYEGLTHEETGNILEISDRTVKRRWRKIKEMLLQLADTED